MQGWFKQRTRTQLVQQAVQETRDDISQLTAEHNALEAKANATHPQFVFEADRAKFVADLKDLSAERQILSIYDDRIQTEQQLIQVYERWGAQLVLQHSILLHLILQSFALILFILICMVLGAAAREPLYDRRCSRTKTDAHVAQRCWIWAYRCLAHC